MKTILPMRRTNHRPSRKPRNLRRRTPGIRRKVMAEYDFRKQGRRGGGLKTYD
jgi:hypothetical protein